MRFLIVIQWPTMTVTSLVGAFLFALACSACAAQSRSERRLPLIEEHDRRPTTNTRRIGCLFGESFHELMAEWHPRLDSPLPCFKCKCLPGRRRGRATGRVSCKNFGDQCPEPTCENPITAADQCCKLCPDQDESTIDVFGLRDHEDQIDGNTGNQEFAALMTGRFRNQAVLTEGVGRAYITLHEGNVHYSIYLERLEEPPTGIKFLDVKHTILHEQEKEYSNDGKICGVWSEVPSYYIKALQKGQLSLIVTTKKQSDGAIGGMISEEKLLANEAFSSLLLPTALSGAISLGYGAMAVFNLQSSRHSLEVHVRITAKLQPNKKTGEYEVLLNFDKNDGSRKRLVNHPINLTLESGYLSGSTAIKIGPLEQRWLSRGRLRMSLNSPAMTPSEFGGLVTPKKSCDIYQALFSSSDLKSAVGYTIVTATDDMTLKYTMKLLGVNDSDVSALAIEKQDKKTKNSRKRGKNQNKPMLVDGWTRGYFSKHINAREIVQLFSEKLKIRVLTKQNQTLRGNLRRVLHSDAVSAHAEPNILRSSDSAALLWLGDSTDCSLAYSLHLGEVDQNARASLSICDAADYCPMKIDATVRRSLNFIKSAVIEDIPFAARKLLGQGNAAAKLDVGGRKFVGDVRKMSMQCALRSLQRDAFAGYVSEDNEAHNMVVSTDCRYDNDTYKNGDSWHATHLPCTRCHCKRGASVCEATVCPAVDCKTPIHQPGECCPSCPLLQMVEGGCFWQGDNRMHPFGTTWHPYIPPYGFSTCVLCSCHPFTAEVVCSRKPCAPLDCPLSEQKRQNPADCCPVCIKPSPTAHDGSCFFQRRWWNDGEEFFPEISHVKHLRCVRCKCTNGAIDCRRLGQC